MQPTSRSVVAGFAAAPRASGFRPMKPRFGRWMSSSTNNRQQDNGQTTPASENAKSLTQSPSNSASGSQGELTENFALDRPNYAAPIDHGTSNFSPLPKRIMNGSEAGDVLPAAVLSGAPAEVQGRTVRIYRPAKTATQSGNWHSHHWRMDWDILQKGHRWENPLMGWQSSADFLQGTHLTFTSKDDAIKFAEKQGYEYFVQEHNERKFVPKAYANNFLHSPKPLKHIRTK